VRSRLVWLIALGAVVIAGVALGARGHGASAQPHPTLARARIPAHRQAAAAHRQAAGARRRTPAAPSAAQVHHQGPTVDVLAHPLPESQSRCLKPPPPIPEHPLRHRTWLSGVTITEYYPAPERWFPGRKVAAPGLPGRYAVDWLYSARGLAMEGDGVDDAGRPVRIAALGSTGWVDFYGHLTVPVCLGKWSHGFPVWLIGGWRNARGEVTYPLAGGGWANGQARARRVLPYGGVTFALGDAVALRYYHSIAVDPRLIPLGSRVYIPAYGRWFVAQDTGGAIRGRHVDVYRPAPYSPDDLGRYMTGQRILVVPPSG
jgi:3D (Asp-Asp-Asp) domain-containing protein